MINKINKKKQNSPRENIARRCAHLLRMILFVPLISCGLAGCGTTVPDIKEIWDTDFPADPSTRTPKITGTAQIEFEIQKRIYCELKAAVLAAQKYAVETSPTLQGRRTVLQSGLIPEDWAAQIALSLQVDESSSFNPGLSLNTTWPTVISYPAKAITALGALPATTASQMFNLGFGGTLSSASSRTDTFNPSYSIAYLMTPPDPQNDLCLPKNDPFIVNSQTPATSSPFIIQSDLGIKDWLIGAMFSRNLLPSVIGGVPEKAPVVTYQIKFIIVSNGNVTPTWKLVRLSANGPGSLPFFSAGRTRTHGLIITIGPIVDTAQRANQSHFAAQIGSAVSNGNKVNLTTP